MLTSQITREVLYCSFVVSYCLQDNDQQLESASSIDGGTEMSDDGTSGSVERATPCSNVTRSSSAGAAALDKVSMSCHNCCMSLFFFLVDNV